MPKLTLPVAGTPLNPMPVIVTEPPPASGPAIGETAVMATALHCQVSAR